VPDALDEDSIRLGQALADVATIGLLQARAIRHHEKIAEQLQTALNGRIVIEHRVLQRSVDRLRAALPA
jgi:hypothetical protein